MKFTSRIAEKFGKNNVDRKVFSLLSTFIIIVILFIAAGILFPTTVSVILNILWITIITLVVIFFVLGILVIVGMRKEVGQVLDAFLEGSLKIIDFLELIRSLWAKFIQLIKDFLIFAAPFIAYALAFLVYIILLLIYKSIGRNNDVTVLTVIITAVSIFAFGVISKPQQDVYELTWGKQFTKKLKAGFVDGFEVVLFIFFLTMDSTNIFFLPASLNVPLHAEFAGYDFMKRSYNYSDHMSVTLNFILITIIVEIIRNALRIFTLARSYYLEYTSSIAEEHSGTLSVIKNAIRKSFQNSKSDLTKFITTNTVLFAVFLLFPRLKLFTLTIASISNFILDLIFRSRLSPKRERGTDLISRCLVKLFKI